MWILSDAFCSTSFHSEDLPFAYTFRGVRNFTTLRLIFFILTKPCSRDVKNYSAIKHEGGQRAEMPQTVAVDNIVFVNVLFQETIQP